MEVSLRREVIKSRLNSIYESKHFKTQTDADTEAEYYYSLANDVDNVFKFSLGNSDVYTHRSIDEGKNISFMNDEGYFVATSQDSIDFVSRFASKYFSQSRYRAQELDWLYTDMLLIGAIDLNKKKLSHEPLEQAFPEIAKTIDKFVEHGFLSALPSFILFAVKWIILIAVFTALIVSGFQNPIFGLFAAGMVGYKFYNFSRQRNIWNKSAYRAKTLYDRMNSTYHLLDDIDYDRVLLKDDLSSFRRDGLYVPGPLLMACKPKAS